MPRGTRWARASALSIVLCSLWHRTASAEPDVARRERARELGYSGIRAYAAGDYAGASAQLEESYSLLPVPSLGLWSARALVKLGKWIEAERRYRGVVGLDVAPGAPAVQHSARATAELELGELVPRLPALRVRVLGARPDAVLLLLDGVALGRGAPVQLHINPGPHELVAQYGAARETASVLAGEGRTDDVVLTFAEPAPAAAALVATAEANPPEWHTGLRTAAWVSVAVGAASLSASAVTYVLGTREHDALEDQGVCRAEVCARDGNLGTYDALRTTHLVTLITGAALGAAGAGVLLLNWNGGTPNAATNPRMGVVLGAGAGFIVGRF